jgi:hypothetical protein
MPEKFQRLPGPLLYRKFRHGSEQLLRVGKQWMMEDLLDRPSFYKLPGAHHRHACGHFTSGTRAQYMLSNPQIKKSVAKSENPKKFRNCFAAKPFCFLVLASAQKLPLRRYANA